MRLGVNSFSKHYIYGMQQFSFIRLLLEFAKYANLIKKKKKKKEEDLNKNRNPHPK